MLLLLLKFTHTDNLDEVLAHELSAIEPALVFGGGASGVQLHDEYAGGGRGVLVADVDHERLVVEHLERLLVVVEAVDEPGETRRRASLHLARQLEQQTRHRRQRDVRLARVIAQRTHSRYASINKNKLLLIQVKVEYQNKIFNVDMASFRNQGAKKALFFVSITCIYTF